MKKRAVTLLTLFAVSINIMACGGKDAQESSADTSTEQVIAETTEQAETESEEEVLPEGKYRSELTNELIDDSLKDQRPIAVMVDNESIALPHYGLSHADVVYEMMNSTMNGRITRFMALFKDYESVDQIGSIRSVRPTNIILAAEWNAIICHDGGPFYIDEYLAEPCSDHFSGTFSRVNNGKSREYTEYIVSGDMDKNFSNSDVSKEYTSYYEGEHYQFANEDNPVIFRMQQTRSQQRQWICHSRIMDPIWSTMQMISCIIIPSMAKHMWIRAMTMHSSALRIC